MKLPSMNGNLKKALGAAIIISAFVWYWANGHSHTSLTIATAIASLAVTFGAMSL